MNAQTNCEQHPFVSVIMPAFNEGKSIGQTIGEIVSVMTAHGFSFEVIVVDDGSTDATFEEALRCGALVFSNGENRARVTVCVRDWIRLGVM